MDVSIEMLEQVPDAPDWDEYEAEMERIKRHHKRMAALIEREEKKEEEKRDAGN